MTDDDNGPDDLPPGTDTTPVDEPDPDADDAVTEPVPDIPSDGDRTDPIPDDAL